MTRFVCEHFSDQQASIVLLSFKWNLYFTLKLGVASKDLHSKDLHSKDLHSKGLHSKDLHWQKTYTDIRPTLIRPDDIINKIYWKEQYFPKLKHI